MRPHVKDEKCIIKLRFESPMIGDYPKVLGVGGRILLKGILRKQCGGEWTEFIWFKVDICRGFL